MSADPNNARNTDIWIAGAFAAFTVDLLVYPLDTVKTRMQSPDYKKLYTNGVDAKVSRSMFRGVYQGIGSVILATLPSCTLLPKRAGKGIGVADRLTIIAGAFFTTYEGVKSILKDHNPKSGDGHLLPQPLIHSAASATAELVSCAILTPAEVIKQNAQMVDNSKTDRPRVNATLQTMKRFQSNPLALWRGYTALAGRNLPMTAIQFPIFERIRDSIKRYRNERGTRTGTIYESGWITAISAGSAGSVAAVITTPVDVVKTRIMLAAAESAAADQNPAQSKDTLVDATGKTVQSAKDSLKEKVKNVTKPVSNKGSIQIAKEIMAESGVKGLFRGGALRGIWTLVGSGLYLGVYESSRIYLASRRGEQLSENDLM